MSNKGGARPGAGRPVGSGVYRESTVSIRIPKSLFKTVQKMLNDFKKNLPKKDKNQSISIPSNLKIKIVNPKNKTPQKKQTCKNNI